MELHALEQEFEAKGLMEDDPPDTPSIHPRSAKTLVEKLWAARECFQADLRQDLKGMLRAAWKAGVLTDAKVIQNGKQLVISWRGLSYTYHAK